jgi:hypothetical protein
VATATCLFALIALWRFESRDTDEVLGWTLRAGATLGILCLTAFVTRLFRMRRETRRLLSVWLSDATPLSLPGVSIPAFRIHTQFPVVAVVGIFRPVLVVDGSVLDGCDADELSAIISHEQGHLRRWDNLRRALFAATPDLLALTPISARLRDDWRVATEEAADDVAAERGEDTRVHLASALLRIARLSPGMTEASASAMLGTQLPASALYRGDGVERRVRRLIDAPPAPHSGGRHWGTALSVIVVAVAFAFQSQIHDLMEIVVATLP